MRNVFQKFLKTPSDILVEVQFSIVKMSFFPSPLGHSRQADFRVYIKKNVEVGFTSPQIYFSDFPKKFFKMGRFLGKNLIGVSGGVKTVADNRNSFFQSRLNSFLPK